MKLSDFPQHVQERILRDNPNLRALDSVETKVTKPAFAPPLVSRIAERKSGASGVVVRVVFIVACKRRLDDDNLQGACKPLRDSVAASLELDDADPMIEWEYQQTGARHEEGVLVKIVAQRTT